MDNKVGQNEERQMESRGIEDTKFGEHKDCLAGGKHQSVILKSTKT